MRYMIDGLEPEKLWHYFKEFSKIPRCSGNEKGAIDYITRFAQEHDLMFKKDKAGNLVVKKEAVDGFEGAPVVVLQAHVDMVCEKNENSSHDFSKDPLNLIVENGWVRAEETTLGADNGIGVAAMLSLLDEYSGGKLECLFTVEEEIGLNGAFNLNQNMIQGRIMINLDTEKVNTIYIGCAGGRDSYINLPVQYIKPGYDMKSLKLSIKGLNGGHSGAEIHLGRANAIKLMGRLLYRMRKVVPFLISSITGGEKLNAIPRESTSVLILHRDALESTKEEAEKYFTFLKKEYIKQDPRCSLIVEEISLPEKAFDEQCTCRVISLLNSIPHGVLAMSKDIEGLVETSTNLASVRTGESSVQIKASHRSSIESGIEMVSDIHCALAWLSGARIWQNQGYSGWSPDPESWLLHETKQIIREVSGEEAEVMAIHAGLECGILKAKFKGMDVVSIGPTIEGAHSPNEKVNIESVKLLWDILLAILKHIQGKGK